MRIILASKSPRRREILEMLGLDFTVEVAQTDESSDITDAALLVRTIAARKGMAVLQKLQAAGMGVEDTLIVACDTLVHIEGEFLGKPRDREDARRMLLMLSGKSHEVVSGIYLYYNGKTVTCSESTQVEFARLSCEEIERYLDSGEPYDKAGAYAVQGKASIHIKGVRGDYFNVVGLPVNLLYETLKEEFGIII